MFRIRCASLVAAFLLAPGTSAAAEECGELVTITTPEGTTRYAPAQPTGFPPSAGITLV